MITPRGLALWSTVIAAILAFAAVLLSRGTRDDGRRWEFLVRFCAFAIVAPVLLLYIVSGSWQPAENWLDRFSSLTKLGIVLLIWLAGFAWAFTIWREDKSQLRWLAGNISFARTRYWVIWAVLPLLVLLVFGWNRLPPSSASFPLLSWSASALFAVTLAAVALTKGLPSPNAILAGTEESKALPESPLDDWPKLIRNQGIEIRSYPAQLTQEPISAVSGDAQKWEHTLARAGLHHVSPELISGVYDYTQRVERNGNGFLLLAPDFSGQIEVLTLAAVETLRAHGGRILFVVAADEQEPAAAMTRCLERLRAVTPGATLQVGCIPSGRSFDAAAHQKEDIWCCDIETLSEHLLPSLRSWRWMLASVRMIVWWNLHECSGVPAAHLWAVSRRLRRLLESVPGQHLVYASMRTSHQAEEQLEQFVATVLPWQFPPGSEGRAMVRNTAIRPVQEHLIVGDREFWSRRPTSIEPEIRLPAVGTFLASIETGWPTFLHSVPGLTEGEQQNLLSMWVKGKPLEKRVAESPSDAAAQIVAVHEKNVLALDPALCRLGRNAAASLPCIHIGLLPPLNPYVAFLLAGNESVKNRARRARRLIGQRGQSRILQRHLLRALNELDGTQRDLVEQFQWNESEVARVLDLLRSKDQISQRIVRRLIPGRQLEQEFLYRSLAPDRNPRLSDYIRLIDPNFEGSEAELALIDIKRATIDAYPKRIFLSGGHRYRVNNWSSLSQVVQAGGFSCVREAAAKWTMRMRLPHLTNVKEQSPGPALRIGSQDISTSLLKLNYFEEVDKIFEYDLHSSENPTHVTIPQVTSESFPLPALRLRCGVRDPRSLATFALAIRHVLPVLAGVAPDDVEVLAHMDDRIIAEPLRGAIVILELYPEGMGLVDALATDTGLLRAILQEALNWLSVLAAEGDQGISRLRQSPLAACVKGQPDNMRIAETVRAFQG